MDKKKNNKIDEKNKDSKNKNYCLYDKVKLSNKGVDVLIIVSALLLVILLVIGIVVFSK